MSDPLAFDPSNVEHLIELLRELGRTERLEGYERDALRRAAAELERLQPSNLHTRSEYRAVVEPAQGGRFCGPSEPTRARAKAWSSALTPGRNALEWTDRPEHRHFLEHRTVVESEWRPTHV